MLKDLKWEKKALQRPVKHSHIWWWQWRKALLTAADLIEERGWNVGALRSRDRSLCVVGALRVAVRGTVIYSHRGADVTAQKHLKTYLRLKADDYSAVEQWNDRVAKNGREVVAVLRAAARA